MEKTEVIGGELVWSRLTTKNHLRSSLSLSTWAESILACPFFWFCLCLPLSDRILRFSTSIRVRLLNPPMNRILKFACPYRHQGCGRRFRSQAGRTYHIRTFHTNYNIVTPPPIPSSPEPGVPEPVSPSSFDASSLPEDIPIQEDLNILPPRSPLPPQPTDAKKQCHPWLSGEDVFYRF